ncbi:hypothetical protein [Actinomadura nitritigenes]|uniref:hypothetical protein n=1 Tax=Actinomadura nitritigenes TaxID=134602 RepID=UPI003D8AA00A
MKSTFARGSAVVASAVMLAGELVALTGGQAIAAPAPAAPAAGAVMAKAGGRAGPFRLHAGPNSGRLTPHIHANSSAQICFNIWGSNLRKGYYVGLNQPGKNWKVKYYGPKHKTCSPWRHFKGDFVGMILSTKGAKVSADIWMYWN